MRNLTVKYGSAVAVDDLDLKVQEGELMVLLGPSGCGKTSTMRSVIGLETPTAGRIEIGEETVFDARTGINIPANRRKVGMVFQSYAIWPHMTVFENVVYPMRIKRWPSDKIRRRGAEILQTVGLGGFEDRGASLLSGGQMQRVALARGLASEPDVLLLDEPLSNLDAKLRQSLRFELKELQQRLNLTTIYVTHDQEEALVLADRIAIMRAGRIVQLDSPEQTYETPRSTFVADFLGMDNLWEVNVIEDGADGIGTARLGDTPLRISGQGMSKRHRFAMVRSEDVVISAGEQQPAINRWHGEVLVASFLGSRMVYQNPVGWRSKADGGCRRRRTSSDRG